MIPKTNHELAVKDPEVGCGATSWADPRCIAQNILPLCRAWNAKCNKIEGQWTGTWYSFLTLSRGRLDSWAWVNVEDIFISYPHYLDAQSPLTLLEWGMTCLANYCLSISVSPVPKVFVAETLNLPINKLLNSYKLKTGISDDHERSVVICPLLSPSITAHN